MFILSICHPSIFLCPSSHLLNHLPPYPYHPSRFTNPPVYPAVRHQFRHPCVIRPSSAPPFSSPLLQRGLILSLSPRLPFPNAQSCLIPGLPVRLALSLIPSPCLPPSFSRQRCCSPIRPTASFWPLTPVPLEARAPPHPPGPNPPTPRVSPSTAGLCGAPL